MALKVSGAPDLSLNTALTSWSVLIAVINLSTTALISGAMLSA